MADQHLECERRGDRLRDQRVRVRWSGYAHGLFIEMCGVMERWLRLVDWTPVRRDAVSLEYDARGHGLTGE